MNAAAERLFGLPHEEIAGRAFASLLRGAYAESKAFAGATEAASVEIEIAGAGGETIFCTASFTPLPARSARAPGFGVILCGCKIPA